MLPRGIKQEAEKVLLDYYGAPAGIEGSSTLGGGSINAAFRVETTEEDVFLKCNDVHSYPDMFEKESAGLSLMRKTRTVYVPEVIGTGKTHSHSFIIMEFIHSGMRKDSFWDDFGKNLAAMHGHSSKMFGLDHDNYMGSLVQSNNRHQNWYDFFILQRLEPQVRLARNSGYLNQGHIDQFQRLYKELINIIPEEKPALVHGDLYSGNYLITDSGTPCILDPATAYNHREVDIAMSTLFGLFDDRFYSSYNEESPMHPGWEQRIDIYNLYPLLVHVNLFGMAYLSSVERITRKFSQG